MIKNIYYYVIDVVLSKKINHICFEGLIVLVVTSSKIVSLLLLGGRTTHSRFKIPLNMDDNSTCEIKKNYTSIKAYKNNFVNSLG